MLDHILSALNSGKTVYISTFTRCTKVTPKIFKTWNDRGLELFKSDGKHTWMASGKNFVCIDYCKISVGA